MLSFRCFLLSVFVAVVLAPSAAWSFQRLAATTPRRLTCQPASSTTKNRKTMSLLLPLSSRRRCPRQRRVFLHYTNHLEVQSELDNSLYAASIVNTSTTTKHDHEEYDNGSDATTAIPNRFRMLVRRLVQTCWLHVGRWFHRVTRVFLPQRYAIYVLQLQDGKYYVGSTSNLRKRYRQHVTGAGGAAWTRRHKPVGMAFCHRRVPALYYLGLEAKVTAEWMLKHGVNNVRGAMFAETRKYTLDDLDALTGFLGHYLDLSYFQIEAVLRQSLPATDDVQQHDSSSSSLSDGRRNRPRRRHKRSVRANDVCFRCGERGHWAASCPNEPNVDTE